jgi:hypothetical protein
MGTPASLLDLIARGGPMEVGRVNRLRDSEMDANAARIKQAEAATRNADVQTEKAMIEADAMRQAQADQQVISDAFAHVGGNPALMDKYIKANASGAGVQRWQMDNMKLREQMSKAGAADLDRAEKVHKVMGSSLGYLNDVPDEQLQAEYAKVAPAVQQLDPSIQLPPQIDRMGLKRLMGQLTYADEILKQQKEAAALEQTKVQTANYRQEADLKERAAFLQGVRPDMPYAEYKALPGYEKFAKVYPSPAAAAAAAKVEGIAVKDRTKAEQDARVLAGMSPTGITAEQQARMDQDKAEAEQRARQHQESLSVTMRGQNMTDERARELRGDNAAKLEQGAVTKIAELEDGILQVESLSKAIEKGKGYMGPGGGLATAPILGGIAQAVGYTGPAKLQAEIDLIKQTIGKALEGGVLRKEDEAKYAKILPTINDTIDVARSKTAMLREKLRADLNTFKQTQAQAGRKIPEGIVRPDGKKDSLGVR